MYPARSTAATPSAVMASHCHAPGRPSQLSGPLADIRDSATASTANRFNSPAYALMPSEMSRNPTAATQDERRLVSEIGITLVSTVESDGLRLALRWVLFGCVRCRICLDGARRRPPGGVSGGWTHARDCAGLGLRRWTGAGSSGAKAIRRRYLTGRRGMASGPNSRRLGFEFADGERGRAARGR
jgi:hypothetical protein